MNKKPCGCYKKRGNPIHYCNVHGEAFEMLAILDRVALCNLQNGVNGLTVDQISIDARAILGRIIGASRG